MPAPEASARVEKHEYSSQPQMKSEIFDAKVKLAKMILQHEEYLQLLNRATAASDSSENTENVDYEELTRIRVTFVSNYCAKNIALPLAMLIITYRTR
jgi:hypothetical protein